jgi:hypothetical protein
MRLVRSNTDSGSKIRVSYDDNITLYLAFIVRNIICQFIKIELIIITNNSLIYIIWDHNLLKVEMF